MLRVIVILLFCIISTNGFSQEVFSTPDKNVVLDSSPEYPEGFDAFFRKLNITFRLPPSSIKPLYEGILAVHFTLDTAGSMILDSINFDQMSSQRKLVMQRQIVRAQEDLVQEFIRIFDRFPTWIPGYSRGQAVPVRYTLHYKIDFE